MVGESDLLRSALLDVAHQLDLPLSSAQADRLLAYLALLRQWNATYNLTAIRDPAQMLTAHVADCLATVAPLHRQLRLGATRLLDVGSGGGLPGVVIAILCPSLSVSCVDAVGKKAAFVQQVAGELSLRNLRSQHARVEQLRDPSFDVVTSRAFATLTEFTQLTRRCLADTGIWMAMKGKTPSDELALLPTDVAVFHVEPLVVPGLGADRCLVWMRPA